MGVCGDAINTFPPAGVHLGRRSGSEPGGGSDDQRAGGRGQRQRVDRPDPSDVRRSGRRGAVHGWGQGRRAQALRPGALLRCQRAGGAYGRRGTGPRRGGRGKAEDFGHRDPWQREGERVRYRVGAQDSAGGPVRLERARGLEGGGAQPVRGQGLPVRVRRGVDRGCAWKRGARGPDHRGEHEGHRQEDSVRGKRSGRGLRAQEGDGDEGGPLVEDRRLSRRGHPRHRSG